MKIELPPPKPVAMLRGDATLHLYPDHQAEKWRDHELVTVEAMRAYAEAAVLAERERCARIATSHATCGCNGTRGRCNIDDTPLAIAKQIRSQEG